MPQRENLLDLTPAQAEARLRAVAVELGLEPYRGSQVARRLWQTPAPTFEAMTEVPRNFREALDARFPRSSSSSETEATASRGAVKERG